MKNDKLLTLCQRHQAVLLSNGEQVLNIAVVGTPPGELMAALRFSTQKRIDIECWDQPRMDQHLHTSHDSYLPAARDDNGNVVELLNQTFQQALQQRASDIHVEPGEDVLRIRLRVDGVLHSLPDFAPTLSAPLTARLKVLGNLDIAERRLPQDGQFTVDITGRSVSFRIATLPCRGGEKVVLRLLHQVKLALDINTLGMDNAQLEAFLQALNQPQGLILVTGPTGSGKTVTLYSALQARNRPEINLCSVEDPVEIPLDGINQTQINTRAGLTFQSVLRALLRQDPDVVMVGEIRDTETAEIAINAAQTGHLVLSTLHTNSTTETLVRLQQMGVARWMISSALLLVIAQRLVRRLCPHCCQQEGYHDSLPVSLWPKALPRWRAVGCEHCYHGYHGRIALFEVLTIMPSLKQAIVSGASPEDVQRLARDSGMMTLFEHGCKAVEQGQTTVEELLRVIGVPDGE
ncbi:type II secretion system protein GspE [Scandinavium sp. TWS1a]|uniref:type II secretion system protein GspE n=1 Tax=Scandinavium tedordense TaxID=2926521 RepID=UPI002165BBCE|nr:type II secretion system protein GspE [Scandinavium tedordense]MCS2170296.1 type II secretion system protein GspE [Scandinavium tedordense]